MRLPTFYEQNLIPNWGNYFNSIKVRLKLNRVLAHNYLTLFQFHKGTIKTQGGRGSGRSLRRFQFHKGTIKTSMNVAHTDRITRFQFHKGTIKTARGCGTPSRMVISIP